MIGSPFALPRAGIGTPAASRQQYAGPPGTGLAANRPQAARPRRLRIAPPAVVSRRSKRAMSPGAARRGHPCPRPDSPNVIQPRIRNNNDNIRNERFIGRRIRTASTGSRRKQPARSVKMHGWGRRITCPATESRGLPIIVMWATGSERERLFWRTPLPRHVPHPVWIAGASRRTTTRMRKQQTEDPRVHER